MSGRSSHAPAAPLDLVVLVDGEVRPEPDLMRWAAQVEANPVGRVDESQVAGVRVSTVFRWIVDPFGGAFETMTFGPGGWNHQCWRYATLDAARIGHAAVVEALNASHSPDDVNIGEHETSAP